MKKIFTLLLGGVFAVSLANAQTFSDDFESYTVGSYLGASSSAWTTWSGSTGGSEDVKIVDSDANSGTQSIYFSSTNQQGGPIDVVLPFASVYSSGYFSFAAKFKVPSTKTAYFNFQANPTVAEVWALECHFNEDESVVFRAATDTFLTDFYPSGTWFEIKIEIDFELNEWEVFIDNNSIGTFSNPENRVASLNLYPANSSASFWVDDVSYNHSGVSVNEVTAFNDQIALYPNPSSNTAFLSMNMDKESPVQVSIYQINGALVSDKDYGMLSSGPINLPIEIVNFNAGVYFVKVMTEDESAVMKMVVE